MLFCAINFAEPAQLHIHLHSSKSSLSTVWVRKKVVVPDGIVESLNANP